MEEYRIRVRKSELLSVVVLLIYALAAIVFFLGLISHTTEPIIQTLLMIVAGVMFNYYNESFFIVTDRGVTINTKGSFKWQDIELLNISKSMINFKIVNEKTMSFRINPNEDKKKLSNTIKYVNSKMRNSSDEYDIEYERMKHKEG